MQFASIQPETPTYDGIAAQYQQFHEQFDAAEDAATRMDVVRQWDQLRRELDTWNSMAHLHFAQDTTNEQYKQAKDYRDELEPKLTDLEVAWKRKMLTKPYRDEVREEFGGQAIALWESDVSAFDPVLEPLLVEESKLESQYTALLAGAKVTVRGESMSLSDVAKFRERPDRDLRYEAEQAKWSWYEENRSELDEIFAKLVQLRQQMAEKMGDPTYVELGYRRMTRVDYDRNDVAKFRNAVRQRVVPLCEKLIRQQQDTLNLSEPVKYWDESLLDVSGNPKPEGDYDWMIQRATAMFDAMGHSLDEFFRLMVDGDFMDLKDREGKAGGGFCTSFFSEGMPYIFANFNGTKGDVEVFTHEIGHAFQNYLSRDQVLCDYIWPTYESCEIHSMGLEFLTWPHMEQFFGDSADRFRRIHLEQSLRFLPYGVAVDHFQHLVYEQPDATPEQRHAMWQEMERTYLPWRHYGDLPHVAHGAFWQQQRHIYLSPFYYIDYTLALTCAMQLWVRSEQDYESTMKDYVQLCCRGGRAPFRQLAESAKLRSPFEDGCLDEVVDAAENYLSQ